MKSKLILSSLMALSLMACSSKPVSVNYYHLNSDNSPFLQPLNKVKSLLVIEPIKLADYLITGGIAMQLSEHQLQISAQHRWSEPLSKSITQRIIRSMYQLKPSILVESASTQWLHKPHYSLRMTVDNFVITAHHSALVAGTFWLTDEKKQLLVKQQFAIEQDIKADGYNASVAAFEQAVIKLSQQIQAFLP